MNGRLIVPSAVIAAAQAAVFASPPCANPVAESTSTCASGVYCRLGFRVTTDLIDGCVTDCSGSTAASAVAASLRPEMCWTSGVRPIVLCNNAQASPSQSLTNNPLFSSAACTTAGDTDQIPGPPLSPDNRYAEASVSLSCLHSVIQATGGVTASHMTYSCQMVCPPTFTDGRDGIGMDVAMPIAVMAVTGTVTSCVPQTLPKLRVQLDILQADAGLFDACTLGGGAGGQRTMAYYRVVPLQHLGSQTSATMSGVVLKSESATGSSQLSQIGSGVGTTLLSGGTAQLDYPLSGSNPQLTASVAIYAGYGDVNGDGKLSRHDRIGFAALVGTGLGDANYRPDTDQDLDGDVDLADWVAFNTLSNVLDCAADICGLGGGFNPPDGQITQDDLNEYISRFFANHLTADICGLGGSGSSDGQITADDLNKYFSLFFSTSTCP